MDRQPYPPPGSCMVKNSQGPASVETVQGGVPPYGVIETLVVNGHLRVCPMWQIRGRLQCTDPLGGPSPHENCW